MNVKVIIILHRLVRNRKITERPFAFTGSSVEDPKLAKEDRVNPGYSCGCQIRL